jgi:hypothetical protein
MDQALKIFGLTGDAARQNVEQSSSNVLVMMESTNFITGAWRDLSGEWMRFAQTRAERNLDHLDHLLSCRSVQDCMALQTQMLRDNFEAFLHTARRTSERSTQAAEQAARRMGEATLAPH